MKFCNKVCSMWRRNQWIFPIKFECGMDENPIMTKEGPIVPRKCEWRFR